MEEQKNNQSYSYVLHQAPFVLVSRIIVIELLIAMIHYSVRILLSQVSTYLNVTISVGFLTIEIVLLQLTNLYLVIVALLRWINTQYILNPKEVIIKTGVFTTKSVTYEFANLQSMTVTQSLIQKLFKFGTIKLFNPVLKEEIYLIDMPDPNKYASIIQQHQPEITPLIKKR